MAKLKAGDRIDCKIKEAIIVGPYKEYDHIKSFEIVSADKRGYYLYVPPYLSLNETVKADIYLCKQLNIDAKFLDTQVIYIDASLIYKVRYIMDGMCCCKCQDFIIMAGPNQLDGTMICFSCRSNHYR